MLTMYFTKKGRLLKHQPKSGIYYRINNPGINRREFTVGIKCIYG